MSRVRGTKEQKVLRHTHSHFSDGVQRGGVPSSHSGSVSLQTVHVHGNSVPSRALSAYTLVIRGHLPPGWSISSLDSSVGKHLPLFLYLPPLAGLGSGPLCCSPPTLSQGLPTEATQAGRGGFARLALGPGPGTAPLQVSISSFVKWQHYLDEAKAGVKVTSIFPASWTAGAESRQGPNSLATRLRCLALDHL